MKNSHKLALEYNFLSIKIKQKQNENMESESTYAIIVDTKKELLQLISKKNKLEQTYAMIAETS